jgi:flavodoxin
MKIAIIFFSQTGHTQRLAKLIESKLVKSGNEVAMTQLQTDKPIAGGTIKQHADFEVTNLPNVSGYDAVLMGCPVWAFGPAVVAYKALTMLKDLKGKRFIPFTTMGFPLVGMGGRNCIKHLSKVAAEKGATVLPGIIVPKMFHNFEQLLEQGAEDCARSLQS